MNRAAAFRKYCSQRAGANKRGVGWELTFEQWLEWWGADLDKRGRGTSNLQMQRLADTGPYKLGNIRKGTPLQNMKTKGRMQRLRATLKAAEERAARPMPDFRDYLPPDPITEDEEWLHENVGWGSQKHNTWALS